MNIYFDFVTGGRTQSREYLNSVELNIQLPSLQSLAQVISLIETLFISGNCCHNVLVIANASLGIHKKIRAKYSKELGYVMVELNFTFLYIINIFSSTNAFFLMCSNRDVSAGSTDLLEPCRIFKATESVGELLKNTEQYICLAMITYSKGVYVQAKPPRLYLYSITCKSHALVIITEQMPKFTCDKCYDSQSQPNSRILFHKTEIIPPAR